MISIVVVAHNIRSTHNVGAIFRTCEGFGIQRLILSGYTPYPVVQNDTRLPHISQKVTDQIHKTALGAEKMVPFTYAAEPNLDQLRAEGYRIVALEQSSQSVLLPNYKSSSRIALILGEEVAGINPALLAQCDDIIEIPMYGQKESFNVSVSAGIALYHLSEVS